MYIVIELQTNAEGQVANIVTAYENRLEAESKYHQILTAAAISSIYTHSAVILNERGEVERSEYYRHPMNVESEATE